MRTTLGSLGAHIFYAIGIALVAGLAAGLAGRHTPARALRWSRFGAACGAAAGLIPGLGIWIQVGPEASLIVGAAATISAAFAGGLLFEAAKTDLTSTAAPTTILRRDRATFQSSFAGFGLAIGLGTGFVFAMSPVGDHLGGWRLGAGLGLGNLVAAGLAFAFMQASWGSFILARWWLAISRRLPLRLMAFLDDAHSRGVLRQAGAVYQFRHIELQRRLANRP